MCMYIVREKELSKHSQAVTRNRLTRPRAQDRNKTRNRSLKAGIAIRDHVNFMQPQLAAKLQDYATALPHSSAPLGLLLASRQRQDLGYSCRTWNGRIWNISFPNL